MTVNNEKRDYPAGPIIDSFEQLFDAIQEDIARSTFENLKGLFSKIFSRSLSQVLGSELNKDMDAIFKLRNLFAHGRELIMEFKGNPPNQSGGFDENPLQLPAQRLQEAGIINSMQFTQLDYHELQGRFYSDQALLYFYDKTLEVENILTKVSHEFEPEALMFHVFPLPDLRAENRAS